MMKYHAPTELIGARKLEGFSLRVKKYKDSNSNAQKVRFNLLSESKKAE